MTTAVLTEARGNVLLITMNRPDALNAIDSDLATGLVRALRELDDTPALSVGVLTGAGRGFCAGMDLKAFSRHGAPQGLEDLVRKGSSKPLIAAVEGFALGGGLELALCCDLIVAARGARLGLPEVRVGLVAGGGGLFRLPRWIPYGTAMQMALTGEPVLAEQAQAFGLVAEVAEPGSAEAAALAYARRISAHAPLALAASKQIMRASLGRTDEQMWDVQHPSLTHVFSSSDAVEGASAFAERRVPTWTGS